MKFSIKHFFSKCDQIRNFLRVWSHLLKKSLMENFMFSAVLFSCMSKSADVITLCEKSLHKNWSFSLRISPVTVTKYAETADLVTFTGEIFNGKLHFLCSERLFRLSAGVEFFQDSIQSYPRDPTFAKPPAENHADRMPKEESKGNKVQVGNVTKCRPSMKAYVTEKLLKFCRFLCSQLVRKNTEKSQIKKRKTLKTGNTAGLPSKFIKNIWSI